MIKCLFYGCVPNEITKVNTVSKNVIKNYNELGCERGKKRLCECIPIIKYKPLYILICFIMQRDL